jgi:cytochrome oxidase Cu insertion factor (SCO1/SenC/PrrC family)
MNRTLQTGNSTDVSAFERALLHQLLGVLLILAVLLVAWNVLRTMQYRRAVAAASVLAAAGAASVVAAGTGGTGALHAAPAARRVLRIGFGLLWLFDGILQAQTSMPLGMAGGVLKPAGSGSPTWVQHVVNVGVTIWSNHPVAAAAATVWIQCGIGVLLLVAPRGRWSRWGGALSLGWGLVVWVVGEAFGGIFGPGLTWAFGAPGAVVFYAVAGALIALPERTWRRPGLGRGILSAMGAFFVGMAVLQAWPGRGFWQGHPHGATPTGTLTEMIRQMAQTPQPGILSSWVSSFAAFDAAHGWGVNLFLVAALAGNGAGLLSGRRGVLRWALVGAVVVGLADWVLVEDLGFLGGVGTDPNSMIPMALVIVAGYLAVARLPVEVSAGSEAQPVVAGAGGWWGRLDPTYAFRTLAALGALAVVLIGTVPMVRASINPNADPILAEAVDGTPSVTDTPAPPFALVDQHGQPVSLASLRGRTVALTFLDPVCTSDCPLIAQEFRQADALLGSAARQVDFIAIVANPIYRSRAYTTAFDRQEGLNHVANWLFLTGSVRELEHTWNAFGVLVGVSPAGAMVAHSDLAFVIDGRSHTRIILGQDQDPAGTPQSSFSVLLADQIKHVLHP